MSDLVKDWNKAWRERFRSKLPAPYGGWPPDHSEFWDTFFDHLFKVRPSRVQADAAVDTMACDPPRNQPDAFPAFRSALADAITQAATAGVGDREQAQAASMRFGHDPETGLPAPCPDCGGTTGLTYYRNRDGSPFDLTTAGGLHYVGKDIVLTCRCPLGRWMAAQPKCPYGDSQSSRYVDRVVTRREHMAQDSTEEPFVSPAASVRRMVNDSFQAA
jgi:hypothetical protein